MATFVAVYTTPEDVEGFEEHYRATHLPLVESWPGVTGVTITRFAATPRGTPAPYYLMAQAHWPTDEEMAAALRSEAGMAAANDAKTMTDRFGVALEMMLGADL